MRWKSWGTLQLVLGTVGVSLKMKPKWAHSRSIKRLTTGHVCAIASSYYVNGQKTYKASPGAPRKFRHLKYYRIAKYIIQKVDGHRTEYKTLWDRIALFSKKPKICGQNLNCLRIQQGLSVICYVVSSYSTCLKRPWSCSNVEVQNISSCVYIRCQVFGQHPTRTIVFWSPRIGVQGHVILHVTSEPCAQTEGQCCVTEKRLYKRDYISLVLRAYRL